MDNNKNSW